MVWAFQNRFSLDEAEAQYVLDRANELAKSLKEPNRKANDFAIAYHLNSLAISFIEMITDERTNNRPLPNIKAINRSYILITNELKQLYSRNPELESIEENICWKAFDRLEHIENAIWDYNQYSQGEYGYSHNAQVNKLCIINGKEKPEYDTELKKIVEEAEASGKAFYTELEEEETAVYDGKFIPAYKLTYEKDGTIIVNGVLKLKKAQIGQSSDKIMSQSFQHDGHPEPFKPTLATKRPLTTIIGDMGFDKTLRAIFFPVISKDKGLVFRSRLTRDEADTQHIDTKQLDAKLKKLGAKTETLGFDDKPIDLSEIPF